MRRSVEEVDLEKRGIGDIKVLREMQMYYLLFLDATVYWWTESESQPLYWPKCFKQNTLDEAPRHHEVHHEENSMFHLICIT
jgi:hypothetical protein